MLAVTFLLGLTSGPASAATTWNVSMLGNPMTPNYVYSPDFLTISVGDTVNWTGQQGYHSTTSDPGQAESWDSGPLAVGQSYSHTFTVAGTYTYHSTQDAGMRGTIYVQAQVPEFPGLVAFTLSAAALLGLAVERNLRGPRPEQ